MQPCKTKDQLYSDASPNGEGSLGSVIRLENLPDLQPACHQDAEAFEY